MDSVFPWGKIIDAFEYNFDGPTMSVVKYYPYKSGSRELESYALFNCEEIRQSSDSLQALLIQWIAHKNLGLNQHGLVSGICRALGIPPAT